MHKDAWGLDWPEWSERARVWPVALDGYARRAAELVMELEEGQS